MIRTTLELSQFVSKTTYLQAPQAIQDQLIACLLDYFRVASIGQRMPWSRWSEAFCAKTSHPGSSKVLFSEKSLDPISSTFLNTIYSGSVDADDVHVGAMLHPGCIVISSALAVAQDRGKTGLETLDAILVGYESMIRLGLAIQPGHFNKGFQSTSTCGVLGAAVTAAKLMFEGPHCAEKVAQTLGIAASFCGGLTQFFHSGSTVKRLHAAQAASSGVKAALLVDAGFMGPSDILEGEDGFFRAYSDTLDTDKLLLGLGTHFETSGVAIKPHASSARVLSAIEAALSLVQNHAFNCQDIERIDLGVPKVIFGRLTSTTPQDVQAAQMSAPFCVSLALYLKKNTTQSINMDDFEKHIEHAQVRALCAKVHCHLDEEVESTSTQESVSAKLSITLKNQTKVSQFIKAPKGSASRPYELSDHLIKLSQELETRLPKEQAQQIMDRVLNFKNLKTLTID